MSEKSALRRRTSEICKGGRREGWSTASTTRDWLWRPTAHAAGVARVGVVGAAWRFDSEKRSQLAPLSLKFARSNQYYSSRRYMREDMGKHSVHTCIVIWPGEVDGVRRGCRGSWSWGRGGDEGYYGDRRTEQFARLAGGGEGGKGLNGGRKGVDSRTNKTLAASFLPVWPDTDPLYARASVLCSLLPRWIRSALSPSMFRDERDFLRGTFRVR